MTQRPKVLKVVSGNYRLGSYSILRSGSNWLVIRDGVRATEPTLRLAVLAVRVLSNTATTAEAEQYAAAHKGA